MGDKGFEREAMQTLQRTEKKVGGPGASEEATGEFGRTSDSRSDMISSC